ncbi:SgcJ/EcaC family oxidoreductase [Streptomyces sp. NPDC006482]|uniref:SgcJ/EcaC family oxidoreductase n=1 Tax=unclassified Streptomyces TaxID=2593676 RepID=UPI00225947E9|nr:SgcJ/EcaC family oxidoreductase [Streptomyces sp. NBC_00094]MCX5394733.1 SgcJ/EcaC family oxidoreductase [Streptomyces sp. NBC_00094]
MMRKSRVRAALAASLAVAALGTFAAGVGVADEKGGERNGEKSAQRGKAAEREIAALFDQWNAALLTGDPEKVTDRYAEDAVLLPTASPRIRTNHAEIADYFAHFLQKKPRGEKVRSVIHVLDRNSAIDAGLYRFHLTDPKTGVTKAVDARYTYEYEKRDGTWLIVNHHSSVVPAEG